MLEFGAHVQQALNQYSKHLTQRFATEHLFTHVNWGFLALHGVVVPTKKSFSKAGQRKQCAEKLELISLLIIKLNQADVSWMKFGRSSVRLAFKTRKRERQLLLERKGWDKLNWRGISCMGLQRPTGLTKARFCESKVASQLCFKEHSLWGWNQHVP